MVVLVANPILPVITVFDWLYWKHQEVIFLNQCSSISLRNGNSKINSIPLKKVKSFWFYQGDMNPIYDKFADVGIPVIHTLQEEWVILRNYIYEKLTTVSKTISSPFVVDKINKLQILDLVNSCGLKIPQTFIVTDKVTLYSLFKKFQKLLTKPINETVKINTQDTLYYSEAVTLVTSKYIENQAAYFFPTLVQ